MVDRCTLFKLPIGEMGSALKRPDMNALLEKGWTVAFTQPVSDGGEPILLVALAPPAPRPVTEETVRRLSDRILWCTGAIVVLVFALWASGLSA